MSKERNIQDKDSFFQTGRDLLERVHKVEAVDMEEMLSSWKEIEKQFESTRLQKLRIHYIFSVVAASIAILLVVGLGLWQSRKNESSVSLALLNQDVPVLSADEVILFTNNDRLQLKDASFVKYGKDGQPELDEQVVKKITEEKKEKGTNEINQIVVPKGRKADITFSDGTKMYINAGSRVIFPALFEEDRREIVVEGEVYLDVKKDPVRPFIVKTQDFEVKVLGTQFNICAYKEDAAASVVLVEGKVEVETEDKKKLVLNPNQLISIDDKGTNIRDVNVFEYICWKDNIMLLDNRMVGDIVERLSRHYGRRIVCDSWTENIPVSGKLDLREKPEDVVNILCQSLYLTYAVDENGDIIISKK